MKVEKGYLDYIREKVKDRVVLSLGCSGVDANMGVQAKIIDKVAKDWCGFDYEKSFIKKRKKEYKLYYCDLNTEWKIKINLKIDTVVITEVLEHVHSPLRTLAHIKKLYKGKKLYASVPNGGSIGKFILAALRHKTYFEQDWDHLYFFTYKSIKNVLEKSGISDFKIGFYETHWYFRPFVRLFPYLAQGFTIEANL